MGSILTMHSLATKLLLTFMAVIVLSLTAVTITANRVTQREFEHLLFRGQMVTPAEIQTLLSSHYQHIGSWDGVQALVIAEGSSAAGGHMGLMGNSRVRVVDSTSGLIVGDSLGETIGQSPALGALRLGLPLQVDGRVVGTLLIEGVMSMPMPGTPDANVVSRVRQGVLVAALFAGLAALLLSLLFVRQITRPLNQLAAASQSVAQGDLGARVPVHGDDELAQVGAAFNRMAESLQTQETLRRNLVSDVAHELRTPLSVIQGQVEALQDGVFPLTLAALTPIETNTHLLTRLVEDLHTLASAEAGQLPLDRQPLALEELAADVVGGLQAQAAAAGIVLRMDVAPALPLIAGDAQRLRQVILNLLSNALRHTPAGGAITVRVRPVAAPTAAVMLSVVDSGPGIAAEDLPHLFERFYRSDHSRSRDSGGSGLGLTIARHLARGHGGELVAESPLSAVGGAAFHLTIPLAS